MSAPLPQFGAGPRTSGRAVAVLVLGIVSIPATCLWGVGLVTAVVALSLAPGARREIRGSGGWLTGEGLVQSGVICACAALLLLVLLVAWLGYVLLQGD